MRVDPVNKKWIEENKTTRTEAGFLDIIINFYKQHHEKEKAALLAGADGPGGDQAHPAQGPEEGAALCPFSSRDKA
jgi:hypothetical protein